MDSDSEPKLISLITQLMSLKGPRSLELDWDTIPLIVQIIYVVQSMDLNSQPKPESQLMSLVTQTIFHFNSLDLESQPQPLLELMSFVSQLVNLSDSISDSDSDSDSGWEKEWETDWETVLEREAEQKRKRFLLDQTTKLEMEPELMSLIHQILSLIISMNSNWEKLISLSPQVRVKFKEGKFHAVEEVLWRSSNKWECLPLNWEKFGLTKGEDATHFLCQCCYGKNHEEYGKAPIEIKHPLHPKHSLQLVLFDGGKRHRDCYCCAENLIRIFYYCSACDFAINVACVEKKQPVLSIDHPKWHEHTLAHFPRQAFVTCDLCALANSSSPFYICLLCDFVVHQSCLSLPRLIRISRHLHRISFTPSFDQGDLSCNICRRKIDNHYGGYSCIKDGCVYVAHSRCATQSNVWDGIELDGVPEKIEEEIDPPFVRISDGIIQHFSHQHHHLKLDENTERYYDEDKLCQACITPIFFGNFYSCIQCEFILHEACANLSRKIHHPIHPHLVTLSLVGEDVKFDDDDDENSCSACDRICTAGFSYDCHKEECFFKLHIQCATIFEPLVSPSHMHPLFLTSKPGEDLRTCSESKGLEHSYTNETFNCVESECEFAMCFGCATIPQKVRYKHDKHMLTLSYGDHQKTSTMMNWCEACEEIINPNERFYTCDEYCCVTLHVRCLIGKDLYMKPGSSWFNCGIKVSVLPNNHHMSRPFCSYCKKRCPYKIAYEFSGSMLCSTRCLDAFSV